MAKYKLLPRIDYLSTVSGGGYIGSWFTIWVKRCGLRNVIECLTPSSDRTLGTEPKPVSYLRQFSNYLTPKVGLLNADGLTAVAIYLRNLLLNLIILITLLGVVLLLPRLISFTIDKIVYLRELEWDFRNPTVILGLIALAVVYAAVIFIYKNLATLKKTGNHSRKFYNAPFFIKFGIVLMLFLTCLLIAISIKARPDYWQSLWSIPLMITAALIFNPFLWKKRKKLPQPQLFLLIPTILGALSVWGLSYFIDYFSPNFWIVFGTPILMVIFSVCGCLYIGLMGKLFDTGTREWLSRLGAWILIAGTSYMVMCGLSIYGPVLIEKAFLSAGLLFGWLMTTIGGVLTGKSQLKGGRKSSLFPKILSEIAPYVFILGLLILLSWVCANPYNNFIKIEMPLLKGYGYIIVGIIMFFAVAIGLSKQVDVNEFSMHNFYRNRLIRCYIGASDDNRNQDPWTDFDMQEHCVRLCEMANTFPKSARGSDCPAEEELAYQGPYHILNTTLNLVGGENLAWQKRKASSFIMSPLFCGYDVRSNKHNEKNKVNHNITTVVNESPSGKLEDSGYRLTNLYANDISFGTAMAISGAAVSPSMGHYSSPAVAFLMTIFNLRLGQWLGNPRHNDTWTKSGPQIGLLYLFSELFSMTDDRRGYVYLSDGGHFENLGLYELVRRRCRYIIVCDAGQDKAMRFKELGTAIEKCRTDFGIDIDIDVDLIRFAKNRDYSNAHCVVGKIKYDKIGSEESHGILVYIKASLTGDEPTDVIGYAAQNENFPHESTSNQWFDESQFESYRALGQHIAESVFDPLEDTEIISDWSNERIFVELSKHWYPPSEAVATAFTKHSSSLANLYSQISNQDDLKFFDAQLVSEWEQLSNAAHIQLVHNYWIPETENELRAGFYMAYQMIQLMENVYIDLNLEKEHDHPDNRGWMNIFRNWSWSGMFRVSWAVSAGSFGARFQSFCQRHLDLDVGEIVVGEKPELFELKNEERQKLFSYLKQQKELNFVEAKFLEKIIEILALSTVQDGFLSNKSYFPLEYYPLKIKVSLPKREKQLFFHFGIALMSNSFKLDPNVATQYNFSKFLIYFRVQDHMRKMGFGRTSLVKLLSQHQKMQTFIKFYDLNLFEERQKIEDDVGKRATEIIQDPLFPVEDERKKFDILFDSVQKGIGFDLLNSSPQKPPRPKTVI